MDQFWTAELGGHGQEFGHEPVSESVTEADSDTRFFETSDTDTRFSDASDTDSDMDSDKVSTSDKCSNTDSDVESDTHNIGIT